MHHLTVYGLAINGVMVRHPRTTFLLIVCPAPPNSSTGCYQSSCNYKAGLASTARRVNVHGGADALKVDGNVVVEDSYIHDLSVGTDTHNDGFQATGGSNVTLRHNTCKLSTTNGANACLQMGNKTETVPTGL